MAKGRNVHFSYYDMYLNTAETGELDKLKECLANGVPLTYASNLGVTALHMAAISGQPHIVEFLIGKGADLKALDEDGGTPLHAAAMGGNVDCVRILLDAGCSTSQLNYDDETPLDLARDIEAPEDVLALLESRTPASAGSKAAANKGSSNNGAGDDSVLHARLAQMSTEIDTLRAEKVRIEAEMLQLRLKETGDDNEAGEMKRAVKSLKAQLQEHLEAREHLEENLYRMQSLIANKDQEEEIVAEHLMRLKRDLERVSADKEQLESTIDRKLADAKSAEAGLENIISEQNDTIKKLQSELDAAQTAASTARASGGRTLGSRGSSADLTLRLEVSSLQEQLSFERSSRATEADERAALVQKVQQLQEQLNSARAASAKEGAEWQALTGKVAALERAVSESAAQLSETNTRLSAQAAQAAKDEKERASAVEALRTAMAAKEKAVKDADALRARIAELEEAVASAPKHRAGVSVMTTPVNAATFSPGVAADGDESPNSPSWMIRRRTGKKKALEEIRGQEGLVLKQMLANSSSSGQDDSEASSPVVETAPTTVADASPESNKDKEADKTDLIMGRSGSFPARYVPTQSFNKPTVAPGTVPAWKTAVIEARAASRAGGEASDSPPPGAQPATIARPIAGAALVSRLRGFTSTDNLNIDQSSSASQVQTSASATLASAKSSPPVGVLASSRASSSMSMLPSAVRRSSQETPSGLRRASQETSGSNESLNTIPAAVGVTPAAAAAAAAAVLSPPNAPKVVKTTGGLSFGGMPKVDFSGKVTPSWKAPAAAASDKAEDKPATKR